MKRTFAMLIVLLCVSTAALAETAVYGQITYPTSTTWRLYLTETTNWTGARPTGGTGFGLAGWAIDLINVASSSTATNRSPADIQLFNWDSEANDGAGGWASYGQIGFRASAGGTSAADANGLVQLNGGQNLSIVETVFTGYGAAAGSYVLPSGRSDLSLQGGSYVFGAPNLADANAPGMYVYSGLRAANQVVSPRDDQGRLKANVFLDAAGTQVDMVNVYFGTTAPEPATMALLVMGGLAIVRRRRR
jgi:hypothetical protein